MREVRKHFRNDTDPTLPSAETSIHIRKYRVRKPPELIHVHRGVELGAILEGTGKGFVNNKSYNIEPGCCYFANAVLPHYVPSDVDECVVHIYVHMDLRTLLCIPGLKDRSSVVSLFFLDTTMSTPMLRNEPEIVATLEKAYEASTSENAYAQSLCWSYVMQATLQMAQRVCPNGFSNTKALHENQLMCMLEATSFIEEHFAKKFTAAQIAKHCGISESTLFHVFKASFGDTPVEYRNRLRLDHAYHCIVTTEENISSIAQDSGFSSLSTFQMLFKRYFGHPPSYYRHKQD